MRFEGKQVDKAVCPYNRNHLIAKEKFIFHVSRCKDRLKRGHLFQECKYNRIHIILKPNIREHEENCPDRDDGRPSFQELWKRCTPQITLQEQKEEERRQQCKYRTQNQSLQPQIPVIENCSFCPQVLKELDKMEKVLGEDHEKIYIVRVFLKEYNEINKQEAVIE